MTVSDVVLVYTAPKNKRQLVKIMQLIAISFSLKRRKVRMCLNNYYIALRYRHRRYMAVVAREHVKPFGFEPQAVRSGIPKPSSNSVFRTSGDEDSGGCNFPVITES